MRIRPSLEFVRSKALSLNEDEIFRAQACAELGITFIRLQIMEGAIIEAMMFCKKVKLVNRLGDDASQWEKLVEKRNSLEASTLGNLIQILSRHDVSDPDISYLKWVKRKRDYFVHRFFQDYHWPGDLDADGSFAMMRSLKVLQVIFDRAAAGVWRVLERAGLIEVADMGQDGKLYMNPGLVSDYLDKAGRP